MKQYFSITHYETGKALGLGGPLSKTSAKNILRARVTGDDGRRFQHYHWCVTEWYGDGSDDDMIVDQVSGEEFMSQ